MKKSLLINKIIESQHPNGSWGYFHSLATNSSIHFTTEQALKILYKEGFTLENEVIKKAYIYLENCLNKNIQPPDRREKTLNWNFFEEMMLATWIKLFIPDHKKANAIADFWASLIMDSIINHKIEDSKYETEYRKRIPKLNKTERVIAISQFYMINLLVDKLNSDTEKIFIEYIIHNQTGIYYIYDKKLAELPNLNNGRDINRYLTAIKLLLNYPYAKKRLSFIDDWIKEKYILLNEFKEIEKEVMNYILNVYKN